MFRKELFLAIVVSILLTCSVQAEQIISHWVGDYGVWGDANNWSPPIVPDNNELYTFVVIIEGDSNGPDIGLLQSRTIDQLDCNGTDTIYLASWKGLPVGSPISVILTLEDVNGLTNHGVLCVAELDVRGNVTNAPGANLELENIELVGNVYNLAELDANGNPTNYGYLELAEVEIEGNVTNAGGAKLEFEYPGAEINGNLYNLARGTVEVQSMAEIKQGDIENAGTIVIYPLGQMMFENQFCNNGEILLYGGSLLYWEEEGGPGVLNNNSPGSIKGFGVVGANQLIRNKGHIYAYGGSLAVGIEGALINEGVLCNLPPSSLHIKPAEDLNNLGTIQVHAGGGIGIDCNMVNEPGAEIQLLGGSLATKNIIQKDGATFEGFGGISTDPTTDPNGIIIDPNGIIELTGPTNIVGDVNILAGATLEISDGTTLITGDCECNYGTIHMKGGRIIIQGVFSNNNCRIIWEPGTYTNVADFNLDGTVNFKDFADFADTWLWQASWR